MLKKFQDIYKNAEDGQYEYVKLEPYFAEKLLSAFEELLAYAELEESIATSSEKECFKKHGYCDSLMQPHSMRVFVNNVRKEALEKSK